MQGIEFNDKRLGIFCLTIIALSISFLVILFYPEAWKDWAVILSTIVGALGGMITGGKHRA